MEIKSIEDKWERIQFLNGLRLNTLNYVQLCSLTDLMKFLERDGNRDKFFACRTQYFKGRDNEPTEKMLELTRQLKLDMILPLSAVDPNPQTTKLDNGSPLHFIKIKGEHLEAIADVLFSTKNGLFASMTLLVSEHFDNDSDVIAAGCFGFSSGIVTVELNKERGAYVREVTQAAKINFRWQGDFNQQHFTTGEIPEFIKPVVHKMMHLNKKYCLNDFILEISICNKEVGIRQQKELYWEITQY